MRQNVGPVRLALSALIIALVVPLMTLSAGPAMAVDYSVSGVVTATGGSPIPDTQVDLYAFISGDWTKVDSLPADGAGSYEFLVPPGLYTVGAYDSDGQYLPRYYNGATTLAAANTISVVDSAKTGIDLVLPAAPHGTLGGTVTAVPANTPMATVVVTVYRPLDDNGTTFWESYRTLDTDALGEYTISLPAGTYRVGFDAGDPQIVNEFYNDKTSLDTATNVVVSANQVTTANAGLALAGWIGGTVTTADGGLPIGGVAVSAHALVGGDWQDVVSTVTATDGTYRLYGPPGTYRVLFYGAGVGFGTEYYDNVSTVDQATNVDIDAPATGTESINATLALRGRVTGVVTDEATGDPLEGIEVRVYRNFGTVDAPVWDYDDTSLTDVNGEYDAAAGGTVRIGFLDPAENYLTEFYDDVEFVNDSQDLDVPDGGVTPDINAALAPAAHITGNVSTPGGDPLSDAQVDVYRNMGTGASPDWQIAASTLTDAGGDYSVPVRAGTYRVRFLYDGFSVFYSAKGTVATATNVVVVGITTTPNIDAVLDDGSVGNTALPRISGTARVGSTLTASTGSWSPTGVTLAYRWFASGVAIAGATSKTFKATGAQVGKRLTVRVTASKTGVGSAFATSAATSVVMVQPAVSLAQKVRKTKVILTIKVTAIGLKSVAGKVKVFRKSKLLKTVTLKSGSVVVKLKKQPSGKAKYKAKYLGSSPALPATKSIKVVV